MKHLKLIIVDFLALVFKNITTTCSKWNNHFEDNACRHFHLFWWWGQKNPLKNISLFGWSEQVIFSPILFHQIFKGHNFIRFKQFKDHWVCPLLPHNLSLNAINKGGRLKDLKITSTLSVQSLAYLHEIQFFQMCKLFCAWCMDGRGCVAIFWF